MPEGAHRDESDEPPRVAAVPPVQQHGLGPAHSDPMAAEQPGTSSDNPPELTRSPPKSPASEAPRDGTGVGRIKGSVLRGWRAILPSARGDQDAAVTVHRVYHRAAPDPGPGRTTAPTRAWHRNAPPSAPPNGRGPAAGFRRTPEQRLYAAEARARRVERIGVVSNDFAGGVEGAIGKAVPPYLRLRERAREHTATKMIWRAGVLLIGLVLISAGLAMLLLPGPGWASIILGLAVLASEYTWANRLLAPIRHQAARAAARARTMTPRQQVAMWTAIVVALFVFALAGWWYYATYGTSLPWAL